jgi:hypothetical protein
MRRVPQCTLQAEIARLDGLGLPELREIWQQRIGAPPQLSSTELTRRWLSWELQAQVRGGLDAAALRQLRQLGKSLRTNRSTSTAAQPSPAPGSVLMREWNGVTHRIVVLDDGFSWNAERYSSLSEIALRITGTRWSGPRFFGLRRRTKS